MSRIRIEAGSNLMLITASVNKPLMGGEFILDTGSSDCILTRKAAEIFGYKLRHAPVEIKGVNKSYSGEPIVLKSVTINGITVENVPARIVDDLPITDALCGIIGMSFLSQVNFSVIGDQLMVSKR